MFKTKNPEIKSLIWDLVALEENVDAKGKKVFRSSFPKKHFRSCASLKKKISEQVEIHYAETIKSDDGSEALSTKVCDFKTWNTAKPDNAKFLKETHADSEIELEDKELDTLKHFYKERDEILAISSESFDEFEKAIGV